MSVLLATALLSLSALSTAQTTISNYSTSACPSAGGAHLIVARASTEPSGYGIIGAVKDIVLSKVPGSTAEFVVYPATLTDYINSESDGVLAMKGLVNNFVANCANTPLVLLGYSQGAQVVADTLVGQEDNGFGLNASIADALPDSTLSRVAAGVIMGDPTFVVNETFHIGNATRNGLFPRHDVDRFAATGLAARMQSYCNAGDPYCASGNFSQIIVHLQYVQLYGNASADFIVSQIGSWYQRNPTSIPLPTASASVARNATKSASGSSAVSKTGSAIASASASKAKTTSASASKTGSPSSTSYTPVAATGAASSRGANVGGIVGTLSSVLFGGALALLL